MAFSLKHLFSSAKSDGADSTLVQPSNWNAEHTILVDSQNFLGRATAANGAVEQIPFSSVYGYRNRVINGDMRIDQRNAGAAVTPTITTYTLDRWVFVPSVASKVAIQQNKGSVTPPAGYVNYLGSASLSAYSVGAGDYFIHRQRIEGLNFGDLNWGSANAQAVTISFWVYSSLTGTFGGSLMNSATNRSYPFTYTINSASTWEQKTITVAGDTSGTWLTTSGIGVDINFSLGTGTTNSGTAGAWAGTLYLSATGAVSVVGTNAATFYFTGVQVEAGSIATPFERVDYATMFARCCRYYQQILASGTVNLAYGVGFTTSNAEAALMFPNGAMRAAPTIVLPAAGTGSGQMTFRTAVSANPGTIGNVTADIIQVDRCRINADSYTSAWTAGTPAPVFMQTTAVITMNSEL